MESRIYWKKINPAELSTTCCAALFRLELDGKVIHEEEIESTCLFTRVIQAASMFNRSIYDLEVYGGYIKKSEERSFEEPLITYRPLRKLAYTA
jgi:hypothetical protein